MPAFAPILGANAAVLILGSMPGQMSLTESQYYAHPRNSFWWLMSQIYGFDEDLSYAQKTDVMRDNSVAVWDVLHDCQRPGSLDSAIVKSTEVVNDFELFFVQHPELRRVIFNGAAAEKIFHRHCADLVRDNSELIDWHRCPSTSPAHASVSAQQKLSAWRQALAI